jgi:seryl-tRNA synthetase
MSKKPSARSSQTARRKIVSSPVSSVISKSFEVLSLQQEVNDLKSSLTQAMSEVASVKKHQEEETKSLKLAYAELKKELDTLKFEKEENEIKQSNGIEEYSKLTLELIKLRTEIDRLCNLYEREKRLNLLRKMESQMEENLIEEFN